MTYLYQEIINEGIIKAIVIKRLYFNVFINKSYQLMKLIYTHNKYLIIVN